MTTATGEKRNEPTSSEYDVAIVGGGAAGLSAAVFTSRYDCSTVVFDRGPSAIHRCYNIENYLGFVGIDPQQFLQLGRAHAQYEGCEIVDDLVETVERPEALDGEFRLETQQSETVTASRVIAASAYTADYLSSLDDGAFHEPGTHPVDCDTATGRTSIEGLYVAGWLSGEPHQVIISAGHGARVAKSLITDLRVEAGFWDEVASYWDWRVAGGTYGDAGWNEHIEEWVAETIPEEESIADERRERVTEAIIEERRSFQLSEKAREQRTADSRQLLETHLLSDE